MNLLLSLLCLFVLSCDGDDSDVYVCTDQLACNFNSQATIYDNSCLYPDEMMGECDCDGPLYDDCGVCGGDGLCVIGEWKYNYAEYYNNLDCSGDPYYIPSYPVVDQGSYIRRYIGFYLDSTATYALQTCPSLDNLSSECSYPVIWDAPYSIVEDFNPYTGESLIIEDSAPTPKPFKVENINGDRVLHWYEATTNGFMYDNSDYENVCLKGYFLESDISLQNIDSRSNKTIILPNLNFHALEFSEYPQIIE